MSSSSRKCDPNNARPRAGVDVAQARVDPDGTLRSPRFGDVYHARDGALAQAGHVFVDGNGLPARFAAHRDAPFVVLETGFGFGVNLIATWRAWRTANGGGRLHYLASEAYPPSREALAGAWARWSHGDPALAALAGRLLTGWPLALAGFHRLDLADDVVLTLMIGDNLDGLRQLDAGGGADALYLDGFAPTRNPAMWSREALVAATRQCRAGATLATWCVSGEVRRSLEGLGWRVERAPGFGSKRAMLRGRLDSPHPTVRRTVPAPSTAAPPRLKFRAAATPRGPTDVIIIGAGIAGCLLTERLAARGASVALIDAHAAPAMAASGNPAGIVLPRLARDDALAAQLSRAAFLYAARRLADLDDAGWLPCGVVQLATDAADAEYQRACLSGQGFPAAFADWLDGAALRARLGLRDDRVAAHGGWWFALGGRIVPALACAAALAHAGQRVERMLSRQVSAVARVGGAWQARSGDRLVAQAPQLVLANAHAALALVDSALAGHLPLDQVRGQVTTFDAALAPDLAALPVAVCGDGYVTPPVDGRVCIGASFHRDDIDMRVRASDHVDNLARIDAMLPGHLGCVDTERCAGRVAMRTTTPDRLPMAGNVPDVGVPVIGDPGFAGLPRVPGLHVIAGLGSRGMMWAPLAAELLAARMAGEPLPLPRRLADALDPGRYYLRAVRRLT